MADGKYQVVMWGRHKKWPLFIGTETECEDFILANCTEKIYRVIYEPDGKVYHIALYNTTGVLMEERRVRAHSNLEFDLKGKPSGTYLLHIVSDGMSQTWKVVKR